MRVQMLLGALVTAVLTAVACPAVMTADEAGDDGKKELAALEGKWNGVKNVDNNGNVGVKGDPILIEGNKMHVAIRGRVTFIGKIKIDPKAMPKTIDFEYIEGPGGVVGKTKLGIYKLDKDRLEICWNSDGDKERPRKFTTDKLTIGKGFAYFIFARSKD